MTMMLDRPRAIRIRGVRHLYDYAEPTDPRLGWTVCGQRFVWDNQRPPGAPEKICRACRERQEPDDPGRPSGS